MHDNLRMVVWLFISALLYYVAIGYATNPIVQSIALKLGNVTVAGNVGYWLARTALGRLYQEGPPQDKVARAIIIGAAMIGISLGL